MDNSSALSRAVDALPRLRDQLLEGHQFNAYRRTDGVWIAGIGPISKFMPLSGDLTAAGANFVVASLRAAFNQPEPLCEASDTAGDDA